MLKKTVTFIDPFDNEPVTETYYFNFTKAELLELKWAYDGNKGLEDKLREMIKSENNQQILAIFKDIVAKAYGERINNRFVKSQEASNAFLTSEAWSTMFLDLIDDTDAASKMAAFINAIVPADVRIGVGPQTIAVDLPKEQPPVPTFTAPPPSEPTKTTSPLGIPENPAPGVVSVPANFKDMSNEQLIALLESRK